MNKVLGILLVGLAFCTVFSVSTNAESVLLERFKGSIDLTKRNKSFCMPANLNAVESQTIFFPPSAKLINFEGTNDEYCAKVSAYGENLNVKKYASELKKAGMGDYISNPDSVIRSVSKTKYDRTTRGMKKRFDCLGEYTIAKGFADFPMPEEIDRVIRNIQGNYYYRPHTVFAELGLSKKSVAAHQHALERPVNYLVTNNAFCAKPAF